MIICVNKKEICKVIYQQILILFLIDIIDIDRIHIVK